MAVILKKIKLKGSKGEIEKEAIFDSGSTYSCIHPELAKKLGTIEPLPEPMEFLTAEEDRKVIAKGAVRLNFYIGKYRFSDEFMVIDNLSNGVIIGAATLQKWRLKLDFEKDEIIIDPKVTKLWLLKI
ncbi:MAG TPA: retroviral-like aspartic protease [Candidatus Desulfofervidus auxilii]|uniref:Retroviral-like aspartic protease n=1 Tax=Desulfofervidus auxilii TaxID=1621989 RepID=A0A7C0Y5P9_DESA2|nr:retroviral-like aspartic protease [Candidatus Desulfofervidus auxilii]